MTNASLSSYIGETITKSSQQALQADGHTLLIIIGETRLPLSRNDRTLTLKALVVKNLDVDILAGTPFMTCNNIAGRPATQEILIDGFDIVSYGSPSTPSQSLAVRCCQILCAPPISSTICPGCFVEFDVLTDFPSEPRVDSACCCSTKTSHAWPQPSILDSFMGKLRLVNPSAEPILKRTIISARLTLLLTSSPPYPHQLQPNARNLRQAHSTWIRFPLIVITYSLQKQYKTFVLSSVPIRCTVALSKVLLRSLTRWNTLQPRIDQTASLCGQTPSSPPSKRLRKHSRPTKQSSSQNLTTNSVL